MALRSVHIDNMTAGGKITLINGTLASTIRLIKVNRGDDKQALTPTVTIQPGQRCLSVVPAEGPVDVSFERTGHLP